jgi:cytochrome c oxidase cbb3-type subunit 3
VASRLRLAILLTATAGAPLLGSCRRETRRIDEPPAAGARAAALEVGQLRPGPKPSASPATRTPYEGNAYAISEGQRLYAWFNCVGCHAHGGGAIGPPLMDDVWIYGSDPANVFASIVEGRPNGMPTFRGKIPDYQVWQIVAYVRSLGGLEPTSATPVRDDHLEAKRRPSP